MKKLLFLSVLAVSACVAGLCCMQDSCPVIEPLKYKKYSDKEKFMFGIVAPELRFEGRDGFAYLDEQDCPVPTTPPTSPTSK